MIALKLYRPANGTEGDAFEKKWCDRCRKNTKKRICKILVNSLTHQVTDAGYPYQWQYDGDRPVCTAFVDRKNRPKKARGYKPGKGQQELFSA